MSNSGKNYNYNSLNFLPLIITLSLNAPKFSYQPLKFQGTIDGVQFNPGVCAPFPTSELLTTHNPICNVSALYQPDRLFMAA